MSFPPGGNFIPPRATPPLRFSFIILPGYAFLIHKTLWYFNPVRYVTWQATLAPGTEANDMRVISGIAKGRRLRAPAGLSTRPVLDRLKQSLFDILAESVRDAVVLDLFAGSGSLGIEALSRGAAYAIFIDRSRDAVKVIAQNLKACGFSGKAEVYRRDVEEALPLLERRGIVFDIIFVDPPYGHGLVEKTLLRLEGSPAVKPETLIVARYRRKEGLLERIGGILLVRSVDYKDTVISFLRRQG